MNYTGTPMPSSTSSLSESQSSQHTTHTDTSNHSRSSISSPSGSSYLVYPVQYAVSGILRRLSSDPQASPPKHPNHSHHGHVREDGQTGEAGNGLSGVYTPPQRTASPFQPPPLTPLTLQGHKETTRNEAKLLSHQLAEEIRLLVPPRLQLVETWTLAYSLERDGVSLSTLYSACSAYRGKRGGYVLVVRDGSGGMFGAYLSDAPRPQSHYYGTGECFLWRAQVLRSEADGLRAQMLPPPPSADDASLARSSTIGGDAAARDGADSGVSTPERIRFKAFPYSGINDYMEFCQVEFLSVGGG